MVSLAKPVVYESMRKETTLTAVQGAQQHEMNLIVIAMRA